MKKGQKTIKLDRFSLFSSALANDSFFGAPKCRTNIFSSNSPFESSGEKYRRSEVKMHDPIMEILNLDPFPERQND